MQKTQAQKNLLMIFTRNPVLGKVKKRLAAGIGATAALEVYKILLEHTCRVTTNLNCDKAVYYSEDIPKKDLWDQNFQKKLQQGEDLGMRMQNAFEEAFSRGYSKVVIIGSDLFELQEKDIAEAFTALDGQDVVLGPAQDGGYYLLGMKEMHSAIFKNKSWSTSTVLEQTLEDLKEQKLKFLDMKNDIDTIEDLQQHKDLEEQVKSKYSRT